MAQQKALFLDIPKGKWALRSRNVPTPGPGELLVKIHSTALNPVDWKIQAYTYLIKEEDYPAIAGTDSAGVVEAVGEGVSGFAKGDKVLHQGWFTNDKATFQQYTVVPSEIVAKIPPNISFDQAASVPLALATAINGLYNDREKPETPVYTPFWVEGGKGKYSGERKGLVIFGGSTSVGQYAIQLGRLSGFAPIVTTASLHNTDLLTSLGATHVVNRSAPDVVSEINKALGGVPAEVVFDAVSEPETQPLAWEAVAPNGLFVLVLPPQIDTANYPNKHIVNVFGNVHVPQLRKLGVSLYSKLTQLLEDGTIVPNRVEVLPGGLAGIEEGLNRLQANKVSGTKLIAHPLET